MSKFNRYLEEINFSFTMAANLRSRLSFIWTTLQFHIFNYVNKLLKLRISREQPKTFRVAISHNLVDLQLRVLAGDLFVFYEVFLDKCYWVPEAWTENVINIVDFGAHIGLTTLFLSQYFPEAKFTCVEPNAENLKLLKNNLSFLGDKVQIIAGAVNFQSGEVVFEDTGASWEGHLTSTASKGNKIRCYTPPEILKIANLTSIDILKIDIEGAEELIFNSQEEWLNLVKVILIELHTPYSLHQFTKDMAFHGFTVIPANSSHGNRVIAAIPTNLLRVSETSCLIKG